LKPENLVVGSKRGSTIKVADFGYSVNFEKGKKQTFSR
jgi:hypothetical protein